MKATYRWTMRRPGAAEAEEVGREQTYEFCEQALGEYELRLRAENEDGADEKSIRVEVTEALPVSVTVPPIGRLYDGLTRTVPLGRSITLRPSIWNGRNPRYSWTVDGEEISTELACTYTPSGKGVKKLLFTVTDSSDEPAAAVAKGVRSTGEVRATVEYSVECCDEEGAFRRPATPSSEVSWTKVYEYTPAPGQFINELVSGGFTGAETTPEAAVAYAEERLRKGTWVSLGGWGGYIVVGFDHSIQASGGYGGYDFSITGNQFSGSSEPGVVWVMPDENGNGEPDDGPWYELRGAYSDSSVRSYSVTYYRPDREDAAVRWRDSEGHEGEIARVSSHPQSYYPKWMTEESYTLSGTLLPDRSGTLENGRFTTGDYGWGYADNWGEDMLEAPKQKNFFRISDAVDAAGEAAGLDYIDFVKVQTGVNIQGGAGIGELSTEVSRFRDENL